MKILLQYLKQKSKDIALYLIFAIVFGLIFYLYSLPFEALFYASILCLSVTFGLFIYGFATFYIKHQILIKQINLEEIYSLDISKSKNVIESDYQRLVDKLIKEKNELSEKQTTAITEMKDYYTMWAHQIKTPISALDLMFQVLDVYPEEGSVEIKELKQELFKVDFYVDAVLQYLRLEDMSSDFKFDYYKLDSLVKQSVKKYATQFIYRKIKIELGNLDTLVLTDEKWISFVIEQLLSNAIKYTKSDGTVKIYLKETFNRNDKILVIEDTGIGINEEDLPRIFERGFTGYNGRLDKKSTGIGLYLCKKAINKLSHKISIESRYGVGTKVMVDLSSADIIHE